MPDETTDINIKIYLDAHHKGMSEVMKRLGYDCGKQYWNNTIIVPPPTTIGKMNDLIKVGRYGEASSIFRAHVIKGLFRTGSDFKTNKAVTWHLREIKVKEVKNEKTVLIEDGTLTLDTNYHPTIDAPVGEERNHTSIWKLEGTIKEYEVVEREEKKKKITGKGEDECLKELYNDLDDFYRSGNESSRGVAHVAAMLQFLVAVHDGHIEGLSPADIKLYREALEDFIQLCGAFMEFDMLVFFYNKRIFPHSLINKIIYYQKYIAHFYEKLKGGVANEMYENFFEVDIHRIRLTGMGVTWPERLASVQEILSAHKQNLFELTPPRAAYLEVMSNAAIKNIFSVFSVIHGISEEKIKERERRRAREKRGAGPIDDEIPKFFTVTLHNKIYYCPRIFYKIKEEFYLLIKQLENGIFDISRIIDFCRNVHSDFGEGCDGFVANIDSITDSIRGDTIFHSDILCKIFTLQDPKRRGPWPYQYRGGRG